ncbi:hypothetical protein FOZ61_005116 [Perkinsus olseni]|uniref:MmgE/PrpD N-terminal domain-containing protein n=1 Tax=Perkinsus olseni TaxID=32597 RepID=A0A7J6LJ82_PEROL|nr:hypothetical protein FOZ61_005116 [Perkinsus olseni]KAF4661395.1 hypothetical protein FOL46_005754 [Perkinsus olseni]
MLSKIAYPTVRPAFSFVTATSSRVRAFSAPADTKVVLPRDSNQALGIGKFAVEFLDGKIGGDIDPAVYRRVEMFHTDSVMCGISALAMHTNAPTLLRSEALEEYRDPRGAKVFGSSEKVKAEKAIAANSSAAREWDSNGTVFGYNACNPKHQAGEFGHNDFYPVVVAAAQKTGEVDGKKALNAMILVDEIRGRLCEVFSLKTYKIDHVVHGAVASAAVYGALMGATPEQIEAAIGMFVVHYIPWRGIRAGKQLSDSKGASAAISTEAAILCMQRAMNGFMGPRDVFRNPEAIFRYFEPQQDGQCPFDIELSHSGGDFAVMGMHFKLGLYEHQSAGALQGMIDLLMNNPELMRDPSKIRNINVVAYEPAFGIIGDPAKRNPTTRQSADHSMVFIISRLLANAVNRGVIPSTNEEAWTTWMLSPRDYGYDALNDRQTRGLMEKISFAHGGPEYDARYPDGIPTTVEITADDGKKYSSGLVMYPSGHARNTTADLNAILQFKHKMLGSIALEDDDCEKLIRKLVHMDKLSAEEMQDVYDFDYSKLQRDDPIDG